MDIIRSICFYQQSGYALIVKGGISCRTCYNNYNQEQFQCMSRYKFIDTVNNLEGYNRLNN